MLSRNTGLNDLAGAEGLEASIHPLIFAYISGSYCP